MNSSGYVLILALLSLSCILLLGFSVLDHFLLQSKVNQNLYLELKTYYLAQAGIEYATYRLKEDPSWRTASWQADLGDSGQIYLRVIDKDSLISVEARGAYDDSQWTQQAQFSSSFPCQRLK